MDILAARKKAAEKAGMRGAGAAPQAESRPAETVEPQREPRQAAAPAPQTAPQEPGQAAPAEEAAQHAAGGETAEQAASDIELLCFRLGSEEYAVMVADVREVLKVRELTQVPNAPEYISGVASLRGAMLPVIDLCKRLGITPGARDEKARIIVASPDEEDVGLLVDRVTGVVKIAPDAVKPAPETIEHGADYLRGIVRKGEKLYIVLDLLKAAGT